MRNERKKPRKEQLRYFSPLGFWHELLQSTGGGGGRCKFKVTRKEIGII